MKVQHVQKPMIISRFSAAVQALEPPAKVNKCSLSFILGSASSSEHESKVPPSSQLNRATMRKSVRPPPAAALGNPSSSDPMSRVLNKGSKFCVIDGCMSRSKLNKLCWRHGGSVKCKVVSCSNRAKSRGACWSHGGGSTCSFENCDTISVSRGFCWAHGGGKRCAIDNCSKPACERTQNYCTAHFKEMKAVGQW